MYLVNKQTSFFLQKCNYMDFARKDLLDKSEFVQKRNCKKKTNLIMIPS